MRKLFSIELAIILALMPCVYAQGTIGKSGVIGKAGRIGGTTGANTYAFVTSAFSDFNGCSPACGAITIPSTGSGHLGVISSGATSGNFISSVAGGGTWVCPGTGQQADGSVGGVSICYNLNLTGAVTSITPTMTGNDTFYFRYIEFSSVLAPAFDKCSGVDNTVAANPQPGVALTLAGSNEAITQVARVFGLQINSISGPYTLVPGVSHTEDQLAYVAATSSGAAPNWTLTTTGALIGAACAFK